MSKQQENFEQYSAQWRKHMMGLTKADLVAMAEQVMHDRDALRASALGLLNDIEAGCAEVMVGQHKGRGYGSNNHYRELNKLTGRKVTQKA